MSEPIHRIRCKSESVTAVRERIERVLGIQTSAEPEGYGYWAIMFNAHKDVNLDFLRPDVLPPK